MAIAVWVSALVVGGCAPAATSPSVSLPTAASGTPVAASPSSLPSPSAATGTLFTSSRYGYSLVVPDGWTVTETPGSGGLHPDEPGVDTFHGPDGRILSVVGEAIPPGTGLDSWSCAIGQHLTGEHATPVEATEVLMAAGQTARLTRYHLHIDPYVIHYLNTELVNDDIGLTLSMESTAHDDEADEAVLRGLLGGLTLT